MGWVGGWVGSGKWEEMDEARAVAAVTKK